MINLVRLKIVNFRKRLAKEPIEHPHSKYRKRSLSLRDETMKSKMREKTSQTKSHWKEQRQS